VFEPAKLRILLFNIKHKRPNGTSEKPEKDSKKDKDKNKDDKDTKDKSQKAVAILNTRPEGTKFHLKVNEVKYGGDCTIEFSKDGTEFSWFREDKIISSFESEAGTLIGTKGGTFRVSSGERRNFVLAVISLVIIMQEDAISGSQTKDIGLKFPEPPEKKQTKESNDKITDSRSATLPALQVTTATDTSSKHKKKGSRSSVPDLESGKKQEKQVEKHEKHEKQEKHAEKHGGKKEKHGEKQEKPQEKHEGKHEKPQEKHGGTKGKHGEKQEKQEEKQEKPQEKPQEKTKTGKALWKI